ncbi:extracellular solute-binding protein, partial [Candidatus Parcubacteria bacterium]|nr:extracellular solute-binding protein [Candidatus Parcubacteria bacterium]
MSKFQIILLVIFGVFILIAVAVFSLYRGGGSSSATVVVWGDIPSYDFEAFLTNAGLNQDNSLVIKYVAKSPEVLESDFTEALARNVGPDLIILTQDKIWKEKDKLLPIPYKSVSERDFKDTFVEEGELFLTPEGVYALPLSLDPMVLYYNRDILSTAKIANPISYWDEIYDAASSLSQKDPAGNILRSAIALGEASNIPNFKSIISLLMLQAGTPITTLTANGLKPELTSRYDFPVIPGESALDFYTQFSNPTRV